MRCFVECGDAALADLGLHKPPKEKVAYCEVWRSGRAHGTFGDPRPIQRPGKLRLLGSFYCDEFQALQGAQEGADTNGLGLTLCKQASSQVVPWLLCDRPCLLANLITASNLNGIDPVLKSWRGSYTFGRDQLPIESH
ncbi:zinc finger protein OZF-like [Ixodes scapularis]